MAKPYSNDLRRKLLEAYDRGEGSLRELADRFGVSSPWAWKISSQRRRTGQMERVEQRHGPRCRLTAEVAARWRSLLREQPDRTLAELQQELWKAESVRFSVQHLCRVLQRMPLRLKKSAPRSGAGHPGEPAAPRGVAGGGERSGSAAAGVSGRERNDDRDDPALWPRRAWRARSRGHSGRALAHPHPGAPGLGAMNCEGFVATMTIESPTDGDIFLAYVEQVLCPRLQPGQTVILDNLAAHKVPGVRELIEATGAELLYLPPYSPDFNPIEQCWAKVKQKLRALKARTLDSLQQALSEAVASITPDNASAWFSHSGYALH